MLAAFALAAAVQLPVKTDTTVTLTAAATVPVRAGDTLSLIAAAHCGNPADWQPIYTASRTAGLLGPDPNTIYPGQSAEIACTGGVSAPSAAAPAQAPAAAGGRTWGVSYGDPYYCRDGDGDGWDVDCADRAPAQNPDPAAHPLSSRTAPVTQSGRPPPRWPTAAAPVSRHA